MSVKIMTRVFEHSAQKGTNRLMLLCIGDNAQDDGTAFPGMDELASKMGPDYSRRAAQQRIRALAKTPELGVYPRRGTSHDYIVFTGMRLSQARAAIRRLMTKRRKTISEMREMRRIFASPSSHDGEEDSQVPAKTDSQEVRTDLRTNHQEPSVEPSAPIGGGGEQEIKQRPQDEIFNAVAAGSFDIKDISKVNGNGGRIAKISNWLKKLAPLPSPDHVRLFYTWWNQAHKDINPPRDLDKFQERWAEFEESPVAKAAVKPAAADAKPVSPLVTQMGISQAELDANPGLQAELERIYREQGKIH